MNLILSTVYWDIAIYEGSSGPFKSRNEALEVFQEVPHFKDQEQLLDAIKVDSSSATPVQKLLHWVCSYHGDTIISAPEDLRISAFHDSI
jgi:hypothetical protein